MTIDEAIEILSGTNTPSGIDAPIIREAAIKLGIEALKYYEAIKIHDRKYKDSWLLGETKE